MLNLTPTIYNLDSYQSSEEIAEKAFSFELNSVEGTWKDLCAMHRGLSFFIGEGVRGIQGST